MQEICFLSIPAPDHPLVDRIAETYEQSFPVAERRPFPRVLQLLEAHPAFTVYALLKEERYIGFLTSWHFASFRYIEHFAIEATGRNTGSGGEALRRFVGKHTAPVLLEVELPEDEWSRRRIAFYERQGFALYNHPYFQPPYHPENPEVLEMRLMSWGNADLARTFDAWTRIIHHEVYGV